MAQNKFNPDSIGTKFKMMRFFRVVAFSSIFIFIIITQVHAQSSYVLPYPSSMPGNIFYKFHLLYENIYKYWYFGDFGQFNYNLRMADKYLVEGKTLFEYKQYLLGYASLEKSNYYFSNILFSLTNREKKDKDISQRKTVLREASQKHIEVLEKMDSESPDVFVWQPEEEPPTTLNIKKSILNSIRLREKNL